VHERVVTHQQVAERPVDGAAHAFPASEIGSDLMPDAALLVLADGGDGNVTATRGQPPSIMRLTAPTGVKRRLRQCAPSLGAPGHLGVELSKVRIVEIETRCPTGCVPLHPSWRSLRASALGTRPYPATVHRVVGA